MKITYLYQYFVTPQMPGGTRAYEMARRLAASGHEVNLITSVREPGKRARKWEVSTEDGIRVHWYPVPYANAMGKLARIRAFVRFAVAASRRAAALESDVVFASSTPLTIVLPGAYAARKHKCPLVFEVRDLWPELPITMGELSGRLEIALARALERFAYRQASRIIALSPGMAEGIIAQGFPPERIDVIPNSCDLARFQRQTGEDSFRRAYPELGNGPIVLYAGTLGRINGVDYLAQLAKRVLSRHPDLRFVVLGDGSEAAKLEALARRLGVWQVNYFQYPRVSKDDVVAAFSAASLITSLFVDVAEMQNNSANKFFDGLAAGKPVAINYGGWQAELIKEYQLGLVLSRDLDRAALDLTEFLSSPMRMEAAGKSALDLARTRFCRDRLFSNFHQALVAAVREWHGRR